MNIIESRRLRKQWGKNPKKGCAHIHREKELDQYGNVTGDEVCIECGKAFAPSKIEGAPTDTGEGS